MFLRDFVKFGLDRHFSYVCYHSLTYLRPFFGEVDGALSRTQMLTKHSPDLVNILRSHTDSRYGVSTDLRFVNKHPVGLTLIPLVHSGDPRLTTTSPHSMQETQPSTSVPVRAA